LVHDRRQVRQADELQVRPPDPAGQRDAAFQVPLRVIPCESPELGGAAEPGACARWPPAEPLSNTELRVLRYLPTNLTSPEIARELSVSPNTVRTHIKNLYAKLGTHGRAETVARARDLGFLAPTPARGRAVPG
jgi:DNA-binding CsgD family transcriptional regulator